MATKQQVKSMIQECGGNKTEAAKRLGIPRSTLWDMVRGEPDTGTTTDMCDWTESSDDATLSITTRKRIRTLDEALAYAEVDQDIWEAAKFSVVSHEQAQKDSDGTSVVVRLWNIRATLRRRAVDHPVRCKDEIMALLKKHSPRLSAPRRKKVKQEYMLEVSCPDIHMGKLCDHDETGNDYNMEIARKLYLKAHRHIIEQATKQFDIGHILNIPSNDIMHFAGSSYATTAGTRQDSDGTWQKAYKAAREVAVDGVMLCREVAPTTVITHTDNHANCEAFYIGDALECYFHKDKHVIMDNGPEPHKFYRHGDVLLGFGHGHSLRYPALQSIMAMEQPKAFSECKVKEWHMGHLHKEHLIDGYGDLVFRRLPSLSGTDSWHKGKGFESRKCAQGFVWSKMGLEAVIYFNPSPEDYKK